MERQLAGCIGAASYTESNGPSQTARRKSDVQATRRPADGLLADLHAAKQARLQNGTRAGTQAAQQTEPPACRTTRKRAFQPARKPAGPLAGCVAS